jgi:AcrR family transcriptional regulator
MATTAARVRKTETERNAFDSAPELFYRHGPRGVGIAKSTLYAHFRAKDGLIAEYLHHRGLVECHTRAN